MKYSIFCHRQATRKSFAICKGPFSPSLPMDDIIEVPCPRVERASNLSHSHRYPLHPASHNTQDRLSQISGSVLRSAAFLPLIYCPVPESRRPCQESSAHARIKKREAGEIRLGRRRATCGLDTEPERMGTMQGQVLG